VASEGRGGGPGGRRGRPERARGVIQSATQGRRQPHHAHHEDDFLTRHSNRHTFRRRPTLRGRILRKSIGSNSQQLATIPRHECGQRDTSRSIRVRIRDAICARRGASECPRRRRAEGRTSGPRRSRILANPRSGRISADHDERVRRRRPRPATTAAPRGQGPFVGCRLSMAAPRVRGRTVSPKDARVASSALFEGVPDLPEPAY
jgi:hypothetical protein